MSFPFLRRNMSLEDKKLLIRKDIIDGLAAYKRNLSGRYFLYVFDNRYIEVFFGRENFKHLTGVASKLNGENFYSKVEDNKLTTKQFWFTPENPLRTAKDKCSRLSRLPELVSKDTILLEEIITDSCTYSFGTTNLDFSVGFTERTKKDEEGNFVIVPHQFVPRTLRVKDKFFEKSRQTYEVDYIFSKDRDLKKYDMITFGKQEDINSLPDEIRTLIDEKLQ